MRTTLDIDEDILEAAKELARRERSSAGSVLSRLARKALTGAPARAAPARTARTSAVGGFEPFESRGSVVSNEQVNRLRDLEGV